MSHGKNFIFNVFRIIMIALLVAATIFNCKKSGPQVIEEPEPSTTTTTSTTTTSTTTSTTTTTTIASLSEDEINEVKDAIDKAVKAGANKYDKENLDNANKAFDEAKNENDKDKLTLAKKYAEDAYRNTYRRKADEKREICEKLMKKANEYGINETNNEKYKEGKDRFDEADEAYQKEDYVNAFNTFCKSEDALKGLMKATLAKEREQKNKIAYIKKLIKEAEKIGAATHAPDELGAAKDSLSVGEEQFANKNFDEAAVNLETAEKNAIDAINKTKFALKELKRKAALKAIMDAGKAIEGASDTDMGKEEGVSGYKFEFKDAENEADDLQNAPKRDTPSGDVSYKELLNKAIEYVEKAKAAYRDEDYEMAIQYANIAKKIALSYNGDTLKTRYTVRLIPEKRDCLWRISEYSYIYNTPFLWPRIWKANKAKILNPDLIYPGQVLDIPNID